MTTPLAGAVVCVTGAAHRVGRAIALGFAASGAHVVVHYRTAAEEAAETAETIRRLGVRALVVAADVREPTEVEGLFERVRAEFGRLDVLVNSAGILRLTAFLDIDPAEWHEVLDTNLTGPFLCSRHAARLMIEGTGGVILNIADTSAVQPWRATPHQSVSKAGLVMLTKVAALSLAEFGIRVNCVVPGPVLPIAGAPAHTAQAMAQQLPVGRIGTPEDVARACVFLATNDFATGAILAIDGGEGIGPGPKRMR